MLTLREIAQAHRMPEVQSNVGGETMGTRQEQEVMLQMHREETSALHLQGGHVWRQRMHASSSSEPASRKGTGQLERHGSGHDSDYCLER